MEMDLARYKIEINKRVINKKNDFKHYFC